MLRLALGAPPAPPGLAWPGPHFDLEFGRMVRTGAQHLGIDRRLEAAAMSPFLQLRLSVAERPAHTLEPGPPEALDHGLRGGQPAVAIERAEDRFAEVAEHARRRAAASNAHKA